MKFLQNKVNQGNILETGLYNTFHDAYQHAHLLHPVKQENNYSPLQPVAYVLDAENSLSTIFPKRERDIWFLKLFGALASLFQWLED